MKTFAKSIAYRMRLEYFFYKEPDSKYIRVGGPYSLYGNYSTVPIVMQKQPKIVPKGIGVAMSQ